MIDDRLVEPGFQFFDPFRNLIILSKQYNNQWQDYLKLKLKYGDRLSKGISKSTKSSDPMPTELYNEVRAESNRYRSIDLPTTTPIDPIPSVSENHEGQTYLAEIIEGYRFSIPTNKPSGEIKKSNIRSRFRRGIILLTQYFIYLQFIY